MRLRIELPAITSTRQKYVAGGLAAVLLMTLYEVPNRLYGTSGTLLPMTALDKAIPFWPLSGLVYAAMYVFIVGTFVALKDLAAVSRLLYALLFAQIVAASCFVLSPTIYPRDLYPLSNQMSPLGVAIAALCRRMDSPANCLPSLHVCAITLCAAVLFSRRRSMSALLIGMLLALSTLTFKQHYVIDVVAGLALGLLAYGVFFKWHGFVLRNS